MTDTRKENAASAVNDIDPASLAAIRTLVAESGPRLSREGERKVRAGRKETLRASDAGSRQTREPEPGGGTNTGGIPPRVKGIPGARMARLRALRPTPRLAVLALFALLVVFRPGLVVGVLLLSAFVLTVVFLILGYDGFWRRVMRVARWYARRHPSRSAELLRKLDGFAMKFDALLDRFPEGTVDGLYLPDFGDLAEADARHEEALDRRFDRLRESGV